MTGEPMSGSLRAYNKQVESLPDIDRLEHLAKRELTNASISLVNRRDHPTYGYTKASIRSQLDRAEGMIVAWAVLAGLATHTAAPLPSIPMVERLRDLREELMKS